LQARELSTTWQRNIGVRVEGMMRRRMKMIRKGMVGVHRMRANEWGREEEEGKLQRENLYDMQDHAE
jgi:hypothetical protein